MQLQWQPWQTSQPQLQQQLQQDQQFTQQLSGAMLPPPLVQMQQPSLLQPGLPCVSQPQSQPPGTNLLPLEAFASTEMSPLSPSYAMGPSCPWAPGPAAAACARAMMPAATPYAAGTSSVNKPADMSMPVSDPILSWNYPGAANTLGPWMQGSSFQMSQAPLQPEVLQMQISTAQQVQLQQMRQRSTSTSTSSVGGASAGSGFMTYPKLLMLLSKFLTAANQVKQQQQQWQEEQQQGISTTASTITQAQLKASAAELELQRQLLAFALDDQVKQLNKLRSALLAAGPVPDAPGIQQQQHEQLLPQRPHQQAADGAGNANASTEAAAAAGPSAAAASCSRDQNIGQLATTPVPGQQSTASLLAALQAMQQQKAHLQQQLIARQQQMEGTHPFAAQITGDGTALADQIAQQDQTLDKAHPLLGATGGSGDVFDALDDYLKDEIPLPDTAVGNTAGAEAAETVMASTPSAAKVVPSSAPAAVGMVSSNLPPTPAPTAAGGALLPTQPLVGASNTAAAAIAAFGSMSSSMIRLPVSRDSSSSAGVTADMLTVSPFASPTVQQQSNAAAVPQLPADEEQRLQAMLTAALGIPSQVAAAAPVLPHTTAAAAAAFQVMGFSLHGIGGGSSGSLAPPAVGPVLAAGAAAARSERGGSGSRFVPTPGMPPAQPMPGWPRQQHRLAKRSSTASAQQSAKYVRTDGAVLGGVGPQMDSQQHTAAQQQHLQQQQMLYMHQRQSQLHVQQGLMEEAAVSQPQHLGTPQQQQQLLEFMQPFLSDHQQDLHR